MDSKKLFAGLTGLTVGAIAGIALISSPVSAMTFDNAPLAGDHGCGGDGSCSGDKECSGEKECSGDKECSGEKECSGDKKCSGDKECSGEKTE